MKGDSYFQGVLFGTLVSVKDDSYSISDRCAGVQAMCAILLMDNITSQLQISISVPLSVLITSS